MVSSASSSGAIGPHWAAQARTRSITRFLRYGPPSYRRPTTDPEGDRSARPAPMIGSMPAAVLLVFLLAGLLALVPVWRLRAAAWPPAWLFAAWLTYAILILVVMRFATLTRFMLPLLVVLYLAPFVAGPERLARL